MQLRTITVLWILIHCDARGRTSAEFARLIRMAPSNFSSALAGLRRFSRLQIAKLAKALGVSVTAIVDYRYRKAARYDQKGRVAKDAY